MSFTDLWIQKMSLNVFLLFFFFFRRSVDSKSQICSEHQITKLSKIEKWMKMH